MKLELLKLYMVLSSYFVYDGLDTVIDRIATIEKKIDALDLKEVEKLKPPRKEILEIEDDWEPFVKINIFNQNLLDYCDIGSMVSIMPKTVYDSLRLVSMVDLPCFMIILMVICMRLKGR